MSVLTYSGGWGPWIALGLAIVLGVVGTAAWLLSQGARMDVANWWWRLDVKVWRFQLGAARSTDRKYLKPTNAERGLDWPELHEPLRRPSHHISVAMADGDEWHEAYQGRQLYVDLDALNAKLPQA